MIPVLPDGAGKSRPARCVPPWSYSDEPYRKLFSIETILIGAGRAYDGTHLAMDDHRVATTLVSGEQLQVLVVGIVQARDAQNALATP